MHKVSHGSHEDLQAAVILAPLRNLDNHCCPAVDVLRDQRFPIVLVDCLTDDDRLNAEDMK